MRSHLRVLSTAVCALGGAIALAGAAQAKIFNMIEIGADTVLLIDPTGIERVGDGAVRKAWIVSVQRNMTTGAAPQPGYVRTLTEYDCASRRTRWRSFSAFSRSGDLLVQRDNPSEDWSQAVDAPDVHAAYRTVCDYGAVGSTIASESIARIVIALMSAWDPPPAPVTPGLPTTPAPKR